MAHGLINTSQQIGGGGGGAGRATTTAPPSGGAIGVAAATTIATTFTRHYVNAHPGATALGGNALTHGFQITFYVLAALAVVGGVVAALLTESKPPVEEAVGDEQRLVLEAA